MHSIDMNPHAFDVKAASYDLEFSASYVGKYQRKIVHACLNTVLAGKQSLNILELNCGTGEDVGLLKKYGRVMATDISEEMLHIAKGKNPDVEFQRLDLNEPVLLNETFDIIFSNFGGLNCISPIRLKELQVELSKHLNPGGQLIMVIMHQWCLMEWFYFILKFQFKKAGRRISGKSDFNGLPIYYHSTSAVRGIFNSFNLVDIKPVGVLLTGEYMNKMGQRLKLGDKWISWMWRVLGADHLIYHFTLK